jgi:hypothetical protein
MATTATRDPRTDGSGGANGSTAREPALARPPRRVQTRELLLGIAVVAVFAVAGLLWHLSSLDKVPALATVRSLERGDTVTATDLKTVYLAGAGSLNLLSPEQSDQVVGRIAGMSLPAGTLVSEDLVLDGTAVGPEDGVVGLSLEPGQYPVLDLAPGDLVEVVVSPSGATSPSSDAVVGRGEVLSVQDLTGGERKLISLRASRQTADAVAALDPTVLRLVWVAPQ